MAIENVQVIILGETEWLKYLLQAAEDFLVQLSSMSCVRGTMIVGRRILLQGEDPQTLENADTGVYQQMDSIFRSHKFDFVYH